MPESATDRRNAQRAPCVEREHGSEPAQVPARRSAQTGKLERACLRAIVRELRPTTPPRDAIWAAREAIEALGREYAGPEVAMNEAALRRLVEVVGRPAAVTR